MSFYCQGCKHYHVIYTKPWSKSGTGAMDGPVWGFNGDMDLPTFTPSLLVYEGRWEDGEIAHPRCHSFIRDGKMQYLSDCGHSLAGQTVDLLEIDRAPF